jgi:drug/metabolite transporter (DMT)-like permease
VFAVRAQPSTRDWVYLLTMAVMWGTAFLFTKVAVASIPPASVAAGRLTVAALALGFAAVLSGAKLPRDADRWSSFVGMAVIGHAIPFVLISWGQVAVDSGVAGVLMAAMPLTTVVLAHYFVDGETLRRRTLAGFGLGFAGIVVLVGPSAFGRFGGGAEALLRQGAILAAAICYACNTILARRTSPTEPLVVAASVMALASVVSLTVALFVDGAPTFTAPGRAMAAVTHLGLVPTALAMAMYYRVVASAGPTFLALTNYLIPLVAVAAGILVLGEKPTWSLIAALCLVLAGIAVARK